MRRTKEQAADTRNSLLDAAERVFFRRGVARATLEEIACEAGMTRGAVYWHFRGKEALYSAMLDRVTLPLDEVSLIDGHFQDPFAVLEDFCARALERIAGCEQVRRVYCIVLLRREHVSDNDPLEQVERRLRDRRLDAFEACFRRAAELGQLREARPPPQAATALHCCMTGIIVYGLQDPDRFDFRQDGVAIVRDFLGSFRRR